MAVPRNEPQGVTVLLVEDDDDYRALALAILGEHCDRARILAVADGEDALDYLLGRGPHAGRDTRQQPRLVLLDLKLLRVHGMEVLKAMRQDPLTHAVPVVVLSGTSDKAEFDRCFHAGANSVVRKTDDPAELRRKLRQTCEFWITVNESNRNSRV